ncbi:MAG: sodium:solute symporter family protein [Clostridia bacterium]|nr:sodium:solute symporter family protein [Clostridia bacterium]
MAGTGIWVTIAVYIAVMVIIGVVTGRKSKSIADFTVGGRQAGAWLSALSYGTAYFSAVMFVGYAGGTGLSYGLWGIAAGIGNAVFGSWLAWKVLARRTRDVSARLKIKTMPQFFGYRYGSNGIKLFACVVIFIFMIPYSASVYKGLASIADVLLGIDYQICMIIIAVVAALLLVLGGYLAQARADFVQGIIMMFGVALLIFFVIRCDKVGGFAGIAEYAKTQTGLPKLSADAATGLIATVLMTSFGTWGLPQMVQKYFGIKDDKQAKRGILISTFFALLVAGGGYFIGSLCHRFFTAEDLAAMPKPTQDYVVPFMLKEVGLPSVLLGIVLVLLIAASVSTLCSITLTASSTLTIDFINNVKKTAMNEKKTGILTKILCVLFVVASYFVANTDTPILDMMSYSWGIISGSFLAPYVLALFCKKLTKGGAWCGILGGFVTAIIPAACKIATLCGSVNETVVMLAGKGPLFACIAMILSIILCLVGSLVIKSEKDKNNSEFFYNSIVEVE